PAPVAREAALAGKRLVRLLHAAKTLGSGRIVGMKIGVRLLDRFAVGPLDLLERGASLDTERGRGRRRMIAQAQPNLGHVPVPEILQAQSPLGRTVRTDRPDTAPPADKRRAAVRRQPIWAGSEVDLPRAGRPERTSSRRLPPPDQFAGAVECVQKPVAAADIPAKRRFGDPRDRIRQL